MVPCREEGLVQPVFSSFDKGVVAARRFWAGGLRRHMFAAERPCRPDARALDDGRFRRFHLVAIEQFRVNGGVGVPHRRKLEDRAETDRLDNRNHRVVNVRFDKQALQVGCQWHLED